MPCPYTAGRETVYGGEDPCSPQRSRSRTGCVLWMSKVFGVWVGRATHLTVSVHLSDGCLQKVAFLVYK